MYDNLGRVGRRSDRTFLRQLDPQSIHDRQPIPVLGFHQSIEESSEKISLPHGATPEYAMEVVWDYRGKSQLRRLMPFMHRWAWVSVREGGSPKILAEGGSNFSARGGGNH